MATSPIQMYVGFLKDVGAEIAADNTVSFIMPDGDLAPITIEHRRLVVPTPEMLKTIDSAKHVAFHPMSEMITRGESPVQAKLRNMINIKTQFVISSLMIELATLAISDSKDKTSRSEYFPLFEALKDASKKTVDAITNLVRKFEPQGLENRLINFSSKRNGAIAGKKYRRVTTVTFPIMNEFTAASPADSIYGVKMSKKDKQVIFNLLKFIIPKIDQVDAYSDSSDSLQAPMFISLARAYGNVMRDITDIAWKFKDAISNVDYCIATFDYVPLLDKVSEYEGFIPPLEGNEGVGTLTTPSGGVVASIGEILPATAPVQPALTAASPISSVAPSPADPNSSNDVMQAPKPVTFGMVGFGNGFGQNTFGGVSFPIVGQASGTVSGFAHPNGMAGFGVGFNTGFNTGFGGFGGQLPQGFVMGKNGPINIFTATLTELEANLDSATFNQIYQMRQQQAAVQQQQQAFQSQVNAFGTMMQGQFGTGQTTGFGGVTGFQFKTL